MSGAETKKRGLLGESPQKAYVSKLNLFNRFAEPELRQIIASLDLKKDNWILDAGCGTGLTTTWLAEWLPDGLAVGIDLSSQHLKQAQQFINSDSAVGCFLQTDMTHLGLKTGSFDLIWCSNAINHLHQPVTGLKELATYLGYKGWLVLGQSAFLADMFFAWDADLEQKVMLACRQYYRDKYGLTAPDTTAIRNLFGWMQQAGLQNIMIKTTLIERTAPLTMEDETYFVEGVFKAY